MIEDKQLDVIVRFHDVRRLSELKHCVFSIVGQIYRPIHINLALQRFSTDDIEATRNALAPLLDTENAPRISLLNWEDAEPVDARSVLLNLGLRNVRGRYIAFLDYDDLLYPEAYELLVTCLRESGAAIAFATVRVMRVQPHNQFFYTIQEIVSPRFSGSNLTDLFRANFCPIHTYIIDRRQIPDDALFFAPALSIEEDYDLLLRICARFQSDFSLVKTQIGDYIYKADDSNTGASAGRLTGSRLAYYNAVVEPAIEERRRTTTISATVLRSLGLEDKGNHITIRDALRLLE